MNRPVSFPFDWLAPGEIRFCACGWHLQVGLTCVGKDNPEAKMLWDEAVIIAQNRRDVGFNPLFWMQYDKG